MATKIQVKPMAIGAVVGLGLVYGGSKMMKKKAKAKHYIIGALVGAAGGFLASRMKKGDKKSNAEGPSSYRKPTPRAKGFCTQDGQPTPYNYYTNSSGQVLNSVPCNG